MSVVGFLLASEDPTQTKSALWPERAELIYGGIAFIVVFALLYKYAWPQIKKAMNDRTARIQKELDSAAADKASAIAEAERIRAAKGDIEGERARLLAEADRQAEVVLADGRQRLEAEVADLHAKADTDIAAIAARSGDELRVEIGQLAAAATDRLVADQLDDATHHDLIEAFISRVGAGR